MFLHIYITCSLLFSYAQCSEESLFMLEATFNDLFLFNDSMLGPSSEKGFSDCARECHRNTDCTRFSMPNNSNVCQLYRYEDTPDTESAEHLPGQRYFIMLTGRCPSSEGFVALPAVNLCIKVSLTPSVYDDVVYQCNQLGGRPIVLEEEDKATAVMDHLETIGQDYRLFFLGAVVPDGQPDNSYVWVDGQPLVRDWWNSGEPTNPNFEKCLFLKHGLGDVGCNQDLPFVCEILQ